MYGIVTSMVTRIHGHNKGRFYLKAHWKASGLSREVVAGRLGVTPEHVSRLVKHADEQHKIAYGRLQQFADAIGVEVNDLRRPPRPKDQPKPRSLDAMVEDQPEDVKLMAEKMIEVLIARKSA